MPLLNASTTNAVASHSSDDDRQTLSYSTSAADHYNELHARALHPSIDLSNSSPINNLLTRLRGKNLRREIEKALHSRPAPLEASDFASAALIRQVRVEFLRPSNWHASSESNASSPSVLYMLGNQQKHVPFARNDLSVNEESSDEQLASAAQELRPVTQNERAVAALVQQQLASRSPQERQALLAQIQRYANSLPEPMRREQIARFTQALAAQQSPQHLQHLQRSQPSKPQTNNALRAKQPQEIRAPNNALNVNNHANEPLMSGLQRPPQSPLEMIANPLQALMPAFGMPAMQQPSPMQGLMQQPPAGSLPFPGLQALYQNSPIYQAMLAARNRQHQMQQQQLNAGKPFRDEEHQNHNQPTRLHNNLQTPRTSPESVNAPVQFDDEIEPHVNHKPVKESAVQEAQRPNLAERDKTSNDKNKISDDSNVNTQNDNTDENNSENEDNSNNADTSENNNDGGAQQNNAGSDDDGKSPDDGSGKEQQFDENDPEFKSLQNLVNGTGGNNSNNNNGIGDNSLGDGGFGGDSFADMFPAGVLSGFGGDSVFPQKPATNNAPTPQTNLAASQPQSGLGQVMANNAVMPQLGNLPVTPPLNFNGQPQDEQSPNSVTNPNNETDDNSANQEESPEDNNNNDANPESNQNGDEGNDHSSDDESGNDTNQQQDDEQQPTAEALTAQNNKQQLNSNSSASTRFTASPGVEYAKS